MGGGGEPDADDGRADDGPVTQALDDVLAGDDSGLCAGLLDVLALLSDVGAARWLLHRAGYLALVAAPGGYGFREPFARDVIDAALDELAEAGLVTIDEDVADDEAGDGDDPADAGATAGEPSGFEDPGEADDPGGEDADEPDDPDDDVDDPDELDESSFDTVTVDADAERIIMARHVADGTIAGLGARACALLEEAARSGADIEYALLADGMTACWDQLLPHLGTGDDDLVKDLLSMRGAGLYALAFYSDFGPARSDVSEAGMIEFGESLVADYELALGPEHADAWEARRNLATVYGHCDRHDKAIDGLARLCADMERALPADDVAVLGARADLAHAYRSAGRYSEAITLLTETLSHYERLFGAENASALGTRCALGLTHARAGNVDTGIQMIEAAIAVQEAMFGRRSMRIDVDYWRAVLAELRGSTRKTG